MVVNYLRANIQYILHAVIIPFKTYAKLILNANGDIVGGKVA